MGKRFRGKLRERLSRFVRVFGITLTIDGSLFSSPEVGWRYVMDNRLLSAFVKKLHQAGHLNSRDYFWVVEWQEETQQAHWHLLVDSEFVPFGEIVAIWSSFRPKWAPRLAQKVTADNYKELDRPAFGSVRFTLSSKNAWKAAGYATKYLVKVPESGFPDWVLDYEGRIPRYGHSRGFFADGAESKETSGGRRDAMAFDPEALERLPDHKTLRDRVEACKSKTIVTRIPIYLSNGQEIEGRPGFFGVLNLSFMAVCRELGCHPTETTEAVISDEEMRQLRCIEQQYVGSISSVTEDDW